LSTASGRRQTARGASNGTVLQERIRKSGGALDGTRPTRFSPVCPPRRKIVIGANSLRQDFALNLLAKRRLCNTVGGGIGRSVEDCVVSDARSRAAATTNLARSSQALVLSTLFMICPQWSAWWPADEQIVPPIPRLSYGVARPLAPTFPVEMSPLSARPHRSCGATVRQSKPPPTKLHRALGWQIRCATPSRLLKNVLERSGCARLIQHSGPWRTKDSAPRGPGFENCASLIPSRVFQQPARPFWSVP